MRIIAGTFRSRQLPARVPPGTRPTSDRLRETLFNILGPRVIESVFLDAYAGTGGVGIEAISRGAAFVCFVERSAGAQAAIRANLASLGVREGCRVFGMEFGQAVRLLGRESIRFDLVFLDPPYQREDLYARDLERLGSGSLLDAGAWVVGEHARNLEMPEAAGALRRFRTCRQGSSVLSLYRTEGA